MSRTSRQEDARCSSFGTAEEHGRIAATLTGVNVKVHVVAGMEVAGVLRCVKSIIGYEYKVILATIAA